MYEKNKIINNKKFWKIYLLIKYKKIQQFYHGRIPSGVNDFQFEIGNIANGIYILSADINGKKHQVKVEILK